MDLLAFKDVSLGYNGRLVLENINLSVRKKQFLGLVGPNGSGKSTLMKSMLGLLRPKSGSITWVKETPVIGYVPQKEIIDPIWPMRVRDLLHLTLCSLEKAHFRHKKENVRVWNVMQWIGIEKMANQTLDTLSGGEMQRVLLARALIVEPEVLFLDEPTASMDLVSSQNFLSLISNLHEEQGITVVIVTHDLQSLAGRADSLGIIEQGRVYHDTAERLLTSESLSRIYKQPMFVKSVEGSTLIYPQTVKGRK